MEYRGYDSAGIAVVNNGKLVVKKGVGKVSVVTSRLNLGLLTGNTGIGHTRWATHGGVSDQNSHPHYDCTNRIAIAHNGIIENHQQLREELIKSGHSFASGTDSEVIAHLFEMYYAKQNDLKRTMIETCRRLRGTYAFVTVLEDGSMCGARQDQPLIIGICKKGYFMSSDVLGFLEYTDNAIFLDNNDIAVINSNSNDLWIFDIDGNRVDRTATKLAWELAAIDKGKYAYHTLKEIHEQPSVVVRRGSNDPNKIRQVCETLGCSKSIFLTASGTSYHCALVAKVLLLNHAKIHAETIVSSEFQYVTNSINNPSVILALSQSGETADVLRAVNAAKQNDCKILSIVNNPRSSLARISDLFLDIDCGPEVGVAATKSFTSQLYLIYTIVDELCSNRLIFEGDKAALVNAMGQILAAENQIESIAHGLRNARDIYVIGRSIHYPIALEAALKIKELSYIHAEAVIAGELKHGPLALISRKTYVIIINPTDKTFDDNIISAREIKARGATVIGISNKPMDEYDIFIRIPDMKNDNLYPIIEILPLQILAYYLALIKKANPDYPRNLAKSVTVK
jgi:glucosamine--fructose-6-phosphate aminotransferase (isomerizing)